MHKGLRVLVVDDERNIRTTLAVCLEGEGCSVVQAATSAEALAAAAREPVDLAFLDLRLAQESGLDLLPKLVAACPGVAIVVVTAYATIDTAVEAMRRGAADYVPKPFTPEQKEAAAKAAKLTVGVTQVDDQITVLKQP